MRIIKNFKNRKIIKRIFKKRNDKFLNNELTTDNTIKLNNEILDDKVDNVISTLPLNETFIINNNETLLIDNKETFSDYQTDLSNPINYIHNEGQCVCLFFLLLLYYGSVIFTKIKRNLD